MVSDFVDEVGGFVRTQTNTPFTLHVRTGPNRTGPHFMIKVPTQPNRAGSGPPMVGVLRWCSSVQL